jgi:protein required for attachment to host cells
MPLPNNALVLVADGTKVLFLRNHGDENQIDLRTEAHDQREDRKDREIKTDAPGSTQQSFGYGRSTYEEPDFKQQEEDRWIKDAADELKARVLRRSVGRSGLWARQPSRVAPLLERLHMRVGREVQRIRKACGAALAQHVAQDLLRLDPAALFPGRAAWTPHSASRLG